MRELHGASNVGSDEALAEEFDSHVKNVMVDLSAKLEQKFPDNMVNTHILKAKYSLYGICFTKIIDYINVAVDPSIAQVLQTIHDTHAGIFKDLSRSPHLPTPAPSHLPPLRDRCRSAAHSEVQATVRSELSSQSNPLPSTSLTPPRRLFPQDLKEENEQLRSQMKDLQDENRKYLD